MENVSKASNVSCSFNDNPFHFHAPFPSKVVNKNCNETGMKCLPDGTSFENNAGDKRDLDSRLRYMGIREFVPRDQVLP